MLLKLKHFSHTTTRPILVQNQKHQLRGDLEDTDGRYIGMIDDINAIKSISYYFYLKKQRKKFYYETWTIPLICILVVLFTLFNWDGGIGDWIITGIYLFNTVLFTYISIKKHIKTNQMLESHPTIPPTEINTIGDIIRFYDFYEYVMSCYRAIIE